MHSYSPSPRVIVIAGPRCSGKTYTSNRLAEELMFSCISQDHVRLAIEKAHGLSSAELFDPKSKPLYKQEFLKRLRQLRYADIVVEGARLSIPFVLHAFMEALYIEYGQYVVCRNFFLLGDLRTRYKRYSARIFHHIDQLEEMVGAGSTDQERMARLRDFIASPFDAFPAVPEGFHAVRDAEAVLDWVARSADYVHPDYPLEHSALIEELSNSANSFSPFYQTVDIGERRIIEGQTQSYLTWGNIKKLGVDFKGLRVCEIGCNNGFFLFKAEQCGATCKGLDISGDSIAAARAIKRYIGSGVEFEVQDVSNGITEECDIVMALNMLHYIKELDPLLANLATKANQLILEVGKNQIETILPAVVRCGHTLKKTLESHRRNSVIGDRIILHFVKRDKA